MMLSNGIHIGRRGGVRLSGGGGDTPWWLAGDIDPAVVVAAYQPKGAASLAASYVNLANPGTYDAAETVAPTWNAATGWTFATAYLTVTVTVGATWTILARLTATGDGAVGGYGRAFSARADKIYFIPRSEINAAAWANGGGYLKAGNLTANIVAGMAGDQAYLDGVAVDTITSGTLDTGNLLIGAGPSGSQPFTGTMQAFFVANTTLTAGQVAALSTAMAAL